MKWKFNIKRFETVVSGSSFFLLMSVATLSVQAAPITFNTALPISAEEWIIRQQFIYGESGNAGQDMRERKSITVVGYGITPDLTLFGVVPFSDKSLDTGAALKRDASGLGDIQFMARYTLYQHDFRAGTFRISPFAGVETPTGENEERDTQGLLPPSLQPGSGSWDMLGGIVASYASIDLNMDGQLYWQGNNKADNIERGDVFKADLSIQPRLHPQDISADSKGFLYGALELNFTHEDKTRTGGISDPNSGGTRLFVTPGLHYTAKRWMAEAAVQIPVTQNLNGANTEQDYVLFTGFRLNF